MKFKEIQSPVPRLLDYYLANVFVARVRTLNAKTALLPCSEIAWCIVVLRSISALLVHPARLSIFITTTAQLGVT